MKAILRKYNLSLLLLLVVAVHVRAGEPKVKVSKSWSKTINVGPNEKISLQNQFGDMKIHTWNKNEVKVEVTISAEAGTEERAREIIDRISIEDGRRDGGPYFKTKFAKEKNGTWSKNEKQSFQINYEAWVPSKNALSANNEFGPMHLEDFEGEATLVSKFGSLTTGKLGNLKKLDVQYGKANIGSVSNGKVDIKFSKAAIDNMQGDVKFDFEYCDVVKVKLDNDAKDVVVNNKFSTVYVDCKPNISANFNISTTFGDMKNQTKFPIEEEGKDEKRHGPHFDKKYSGKTGDGDTEVKIRTEYGKVILGHNLNINIDKKKGEIRNENSAENRVENRVHERIEKRAEERNEKRERKKVTTI